MTMGYTSLALHLPQLFGELFFAYIFILHSRFPIQISVTTNADVVNGGDGLISLREAITQARQQGLVTIGFTGKDGGLMAAAVDICFVVKSHKTTHVQEMHITALHAVCEVIEKILFA